MFDYITEVLKQKSAYILIFFLCLIDDERQKLFEGSSNVPKPRRRTQQEILTKYKFGGVLVFSQKKNFLF
jgi:hypothetical protein